jgi:hypothetical protein
MLEEYIYLMLAQLSIAQTYSLVEFSHIHDTVTVIINSLEDFLHTHALGRAALDGLSHLVKDVRGMNLRAAAYQLLVGDSLAIVLIK